MRWHITHSKVVYFNAFIACLFLSGCADFDQERQLASKNLRTFRGQTIESLEARLGSPDEKVEDATGRVYTWKSERDMSEAIYTEGMMGENGKLVQYRPDSPGLIKHERCAIKTRADLNDIILSSRYSGNDKGTCMSLFDKLKEPGKQPIYPPFP